MLRSLAITGRLCTYHLGPAVGLIRAVVSSVDAAFPEGQLFLCLSHSLIKVSERNLVILQSCHTGENVLQKYWCALLFTWVQAVTSVCVCLGRLMQALADKYHLDSSAVASQCTCEQTSSCCSCISQLEFPFSGIFYLEQFRLFCLSMSVIMSNFWYLSFQGISFCSWLWVLHTGYVGITSSDNSEYWNC